jgi:glycosyltransferase involved in cell wall biosynthesis
MRNNKFRVVALLTCRNESLFLEHCLQHLFEQGIETCFIDNESTDNSLEIAERFRNKGVFRFENQPYNGCFELVEQLKIKEQLANEIDADWFIHYDTDEIREAPHPYKNLKEAINSVDEQGYNAINFDEFVFLPTSENESFEGTNYIETMKYYYFFEPFKNRHIKAWKNFGQSVSIVNSAGHNIYFEGIKVFPINFILRHYIVLSQEHAIKKYYLQRKYSEVEVKERKWHGSRVTFTPEKLHFPDKKLLKIVQENEWDKTDIWTKHTFLG